MVVRIFTDGACSGNPGPGGYAFLISLKDKQITFSDGEENTTNNRMELKAVVDALKAVIRNYNKFNSNNEYDVIEVNSDSAYVVNSINKKWIDLWMLNEWKTKGNEEVKNVDLWKKLIVCLTTFEKMKCIDIKFNKVKGHSGNTFNEIVDKLAREESLKIKKKAEVKANENN